jgi:YD repeat-containing protein
MLISAACISVTFPAQQTDREREGLLGPISKVVAKSGTTVTIRTYDYTGNLFEVEHRRSPPVDQPELGDSVEKLVYTYDPKGNRISEMIADRDGEKYPSRLYAYDAAGNRMAEAAYHICGTFDFLHVYTHDTQRLLREDLVYQGRSLLRQVNSHDDQGRIIKTLSYRNGTLQSATHFTYDQNGRLTERRVYMPDGSLTSTAAYQYDDRGNRTSEEFTHSTHASLNSKEVSAYEYDSIGNWIKRTTRRLVIPLDDGGAPLSEPIEVTERTITYHEISLHVPHRTYSDESIVFHAKR